MDKISDLTEDDPCEDICGVHTDCCDGYCDHGCCVVNGQSELAHPHRNACLSASEWDEALKKNGFPLGANA